MGQKSDISNKPLPSLLLKKTIGRTTSLEDFLSGTTDYGIIRPYATPKSDGIHSYIEYGIELRAAATLRPFFGRSLHFRKPYYEAPPGRDLDFDVLEGMDEVGIKMARNLKDNFGRNFLFFSHEGYYTRRRQEGDAEWK